MPLLSYDLTRFAIGVNDWGRSRAWIESNADDGWKADGRMVLPDAVASVSADGTGAIELEPTPEGIKYQFVLRYHQPGANTSEAYWRSGWFSLTADANLVDLATVDVKPIPEAPVVAQLLEARDEATQAAAEAEVAKSAAEAVGALADTQIAGQLSTEGSASNTVLRDQIEQEVADSLQSVTETVAGKVGGGVPATLSDLSPEVIAAIEGGEGTTFDLLSIPRAASVTPDKTTFASVTSVNLVDMTKVLTGHTISNTTGLPVASGSTNILGPFPVASDAQYTAKFVFVIAYYTETGEFISTASLGGDSAVTVTTPATAGLVRLVYYTSKPLVQMNAGATLGVRDEYRVSLGERVRLTATEQAKVDQVAPLAAQVGTVFGSTVTRTADPTTLAKVNMAVTKSVSTYSYARDVTQYGWFTKAGATRMRFTEKASNYGHLVLAAGATECIYIIYKGANAGRTHRTTIASGPTLEPAFPDAAPYDATEGDELLVTLDGYVLTIERKKAGESTWATYLTRDLSAHAAAFTAVGPRSLGILTLTAGSLTSLEYGFTGTIEERTDVLYKKMLDDAEAGTGPGVFASATWTAMGDSITAWEDGVFGVNYRTNVQTMLGIGTVHNRGYGSTMIARKAGYEFSDQSFVARYASTIPAPSTHITIFGGTNDYGADGGVPLGALGSTDQFTFYGALRVLIEGLVAAFPTRKIGFITPIYRTGHATENAQGHTLKDYRDAILATCEQYGIPVLDLFACSGISAGNSAALLTDGLHPSGAGQLFISRKIAAFFESL